MMEKKAFLIEIIDGKESYPALAKGKQQFCRVGDVRFRHSF
jgi:hypothetical protein